MSHWNYRVIRKLVQGTEEVVYQIHEVYYSDDSAIDGWTKSHVMPLGETEYELREDIRHFLEAFRLPILEEEKDNGKDILRETPYDSKINSGHYFEFMDRASIAVDYIYQFLGSHPLIKKEKQLKDLYAKAESALSDLYQAAGQLEYDKTKIR